MPLGFNPTGSLQALANQGASRPDYGATLPTQAPQFRADPQFHARMMQQLQAEEARRAQEQSQMFEGVGEYGNQLGEWWRKPVPEQSDDTGPYGQGDQLMNPLMNFLGGFGGGAGGGNNFNPLMSLFGGGAA